MGDGPNLVSQDGQSTPPDIKMCHRYMIPTSWAEASGPSTRFIPQPPMIMKQQMGFVPCIQSKCTLWNAEELECLDVSQAKAIKKIAWELEAHNAGSEV